ncbi:MAG TPA: molecular chaperone HscC [Rhizomicrobium sp.]|jgi:molecular chaperone HscC|nr:molecular chaperone HscC [Rhizomicrobium sp.]
MIVGIDLGTTNSLVGVWRDGEAVLIPNALGKLLTPSVVADDNGAILVGQAARDRLVTHPQSGTAHFKRYMGTGRETRLGHHVYRPEDLSALVLRSLKADAEAFLGEPVTEALITVPAYFNDAQRKATKAAGQLAGLRVDHLLTEPTAAALAYGFATGDEESVLMVVDLGGGTLDVSLLHSFDGIMEVKATAGDTWLGGEDFTDVIANAFVTEARGLNGIPGSTSRPALHASIRRQAEIAKRMLSEGEGAAMEINLDGETVHWALTRERFEQLAEPLLARVRQPLERALRDARIAPDQISRVIFAGGAARMPMLRRLISRLFRQLPVQHINPDEVVARGAAVRVGLSQGSKGLEEHVMTDVAPFTLGIGVSSQSEGGMITGGLFLPIIERNTIIPASRSHVVQTMSDNQREVLVPIYQGESRMVKDNARLGELRCPVPRGPAGKERLDVRFSYDASGLLDVDVTVLSTGLRQNLLIEGNPGVMTKAQVQERLAQLAKLKVHPREQAENKAIATRAERVFEESLGPVRLEVGQALDQFRAILENQDPQLIAEARTKVTAFLDQVDRNYLP